MNILKTKLQDFDILDKSGNKLALIRDGVLTSDSNEIFELENDRFDREGSIKSKFIYLPVETYYIKNLSSEKLNLEMMDEDQAIVIETTCSEAIIGVNDKKRLISARFPNSVNQFIKVILKPLPLINIENICFTGIAQENNVEVGIKNKEIILINGENINQVKEIE